MTRPFDDFEELPDLDDLLMGMEFGMPEIEIIPIPSPFAMMGGGIPPHILQDLIEGEDDEMDGDSIEETITADGTHIHKEVHKEGNMKSVHMTIEGGGGMGMGFGPPPDMMMMGGDPILSLLMGDLMMGMRDGMAGGGRGIPQKQKQLGDGSAESQDIKLADLDDRRAPMPPPGFGPFPSFGEPMMHMEVIEFDDGVDDGIVMGPPPELIEMIMHDIMAPPTLRPKFQKPEFKEPEEPRFEEPHDDILERVKKMS